MRPKLGRPVKTKPGRRRPQPGVRERSPAHQRGRHPDPRSSPAPWGEAEVRDSGAGRRHGEKETGRDRGDSDRQSAPGAVLFLGLSEGPSSKKPEAAAQAARAPPLPLRRPRGPAGVRLTQHANHLQRHRLRRRHRPVTSPPRPPPPSWA